jgi:hypothetical protein
MQRVTPGWRLRPDLTKQFDLPRYAVWRGEPVASGAFRATGAPPPRASAAARRGTVAAQFRPVFPAVPVRLPGTLPPCAAASPVLAQFPCPVPFLGPLVLLTYR